jgi:predicted Fe-S protein YdhL (DUF1289 family)
MTASSSATTKAAPLTAGVASPCINVCQMTADGVCEGCFRTLDEIACWSILDDDEKIAVLTLLPARRNGA